MFDRSTFRSLRALLFVALLSLGLAACAATAPTAINTDMTGLAIDGYDPVAYFTDNAAKKGNFQITAEHDGAVYRFTSEQHRDMFVANPQKYLPEYGGYCAYGVSIDGKFTADPSVWRVIDGRLYLNLSPEIATEFNKDVQGHIAKANANWPALSDKPARQ